jgi:hypothetical protein
MAKKSTNLELSARREKITSAPYEVGYGKAPQASRWIKGQSGNPGGPKPGATRARLMAGLLEAFDAPVDQTSHGTTIRIPFHKAFGLKVVHLAMRASSMGELERVLTIIDKVGMLQEEAKELPGEDNEQLQIVREFFKTIGAPLDPLDAFIALRDAFTRSVPAGDGQRTEGTAPTDDDKHGED